MCPKLWVYIIFCFEYVKKLAVVSATWYNTIKFVLSQNQGKLYMSQRSFWAERLLVYYLVLYLVWDMSM